MKIKSDLTRKYRIAAVFFWIIICGHAAGGSLQAEQQTSVVDRIVAVVNDEIISLYDLNQIFMSQAGAVKSMKYPLERERKMLFHMREKILENLVEKKIVDQEAERIGIKVSDADIDVNIERMKRDNLYTDEDLREILKGQGMDMQSYRLQMRSDIARARLVGSRIKSKVVVTKEDIEAYYQNNPDEFQGKNQFHLMNIVLPIPTFVASGENEQIRKRMETALESLRAGRSFQEVSADFPESRLSGGGDLGIIDSDAFSPQIRTSLENLKAGEYSDVIETDRGYQIFYVKDVIEASSVPLSEVSDSIEKKIYQQRFDEQYDKWIKELRKRSHIKIIR